MSWCRKNLKGCTELILDREGIVKSLIIQPFQGKRGLVNFNTFKYPEISVNVYFIMCKSILNLKIVSYEM